MKNFIIFLGGCFVGACGTFIYLRKDIKKKLAEMNTAPESFLDPPATKEEDVPFTVDDPEKVIHAVREVNVNTNKPNTSAVRYDKLVRDLDSKGEGGNVMVENDILDRDRFEPVVDKNELNDTIYDRERYVFYQGDQVLSTEAGTIIEKPATVIGTDWDQYTGIIFDKTSLIRDKRRMAILEIYVEDGTYSDEYGDIIEIGED